MYRGTTPTLYITIPFEKSDIISGFFSIAQKDIVCIDIPLDDNRIEWLDKQINVRLSQDDTLQLKSGKTAAMQLRLVLVGNNAVASNIMTIAVDEILKDGVI